MLSCSANPVLIAKPYFQHLYFAPALYNVHCAILHLPESLQWSWTRNSTVKCAVSCISVFDRVILMLQQLHTTPAVYLHLCEFQLFRLQPLTGMYDASPSPKYCKSVNVKVSSNSRQPQCVQPCLNTYFINHWRCVTPSSIKSLRETSAAFTLHQILASTA